MQTIRALLLRQDAGEPPVTRFVSPPGLAWLKQVTLAGDTQQVAAPLHALEAIDDEAVAADAEVPRHAAAMRLPWRCRHSWALARSWR